MIGHLPRNALIGLAVLLWAALAAAWLVPPVLDWNRYRADIAALVSTQLGERLTLTGQVHLVLLPQPLLVAEDVALSDLQDGVSLRTHELRLRVAFWPLLAGRVDAQEVVLRGLELRTDWPLGTLAGQLRTPPWLQAISARIEDGDVQIGAARLHNLNATVGLISETGAIMLNGTTTIGGLPWHLDAHLTPPGGDGSTGVSVTLEGQDKAQGSAASFNGQLAANGAMGGKFAAHGTNLALLIPAPAQPFRAETRLDFGGGEVKSTDITLELGATTAHGAGSFHTGHLDLALSANRLDLDAWIPFVLHADPASVPGYPTSLDVSVEAATLGGANLRQLRGGLELTPDLITLRESTATLPGEAHLALAGKLRPAKGGSDLHFDGTASLSAPALRDTLAWLQTAGLVDVSALPDGVLHSADLRAALLVDGGSPAVFALTELNGMVDDTQLQGALTLRPGPRLAVAAKLDLDRVRISDSTTLSPLSLAGLPARFGRMDFDVQLHAFTVALGQHVLSPVTLDAALEPGKFTLRRLEAEVPGGRVALSGSVAADGKISDGRLDLSMLPDAEVDLRPMLPAALAPHLPSEKLTMSVQGGGLPNALVLRSIADFGDLHLDAKTQVNLADSTWQANFGLRHPGAPRLITSLGFADPVGWLGSGSFSLSGGLSGVGLSWPLQSLSTDGLDIAAGQLRANVALKLTLADEPKLTGRISAETFPLLLPALRAREPLPWGALTGWQAQIKLDAQQILTGLEPALGPFSSAISLQDGTLKLDAITARMDQGTLAGHATIAASALPPNMAAELTLTTAHPDAPVFGLPLDLTGGVLDGSANLQASGYAPQTLLSTLSGTLHVAQRDGSVVGVDLARMGARLEDADLRAAMADGSTAIDRADITATVQNGALQFVTQAPAPPVATPPAASGQPAPTQNSASGPAGRIDISGLIDLVGRTQELNLTLQPAVLAPPSLGLRVSGGIDTPVRNADITEAARWRAEHLPPPVPPVVVPPAKPLPAPPPIKKAAPASRPTAPAAR